MNLDLELQLYFGDNHKIRAEEIAAFTKQTSALDFFLREVVEFGEYYIEAVFEHKLGFRILYMIYATDVLEVSIYYRQHEVRDKLLFLNNLAQVIKKELCQK